MTLYYGVYCRGSLVYSGAENYELLHVMKVCHMNVDPKNTKVALLCGGKSGERVISLASGKGAAEALESAGFSVTMLDPAEPQDLVRLITESFDLAFLTLHGKWGEDGTIQGLLEVAGIPYTGSGVWSSSTAIDKHKSKCFYKEAGLATPGSLTLYSRTDYSPKQIIEAVGNHCVVKPATEGSALGVYIVEGEEAIADALEKAFEIDSTILVETFISGRELTAAVLGNEDPYALPVIEIVPKNEFYDFESKYTPGCSEHLCPAPLTEEETAQAQDIAARAHKVLQCSGVSRSDLILDEQGVCWILETNTLPGMTETSLLPDAARSAGMSFPELCTKLVEFALAK